MGPMGPNAWKRKLFIWCQVQSGLARIVGFSLQEGALQIGASLCADAEQAESVEGACNHSRVVCRVESII